MRRRRRSPVRRRTVSRRAAVAPRRVSRRSSTAKREKQVMLEMGASFLYGMTRPKIEALIQPVTSMIPIAGPYVDEAALSAAAYFGLRKTKNKYLIAARSAILNIESARAGSGLGATLIN